MAPVGGPEELHLNLAFQAFALREEGAQRASGRVEGFLSAVFVSVCFALVYMLLIVHALKLNGLIL